MKIKAIILFLMIFFDWSLHVVETFDLVNIHFLYPTFPLYGLITYNWFWTFYWLIGLILAFSLIFSGVNITNKIIMPENKEIDNKIRDMAEKMDILYKKIIKEENKGGKANKKIN